MFARSLFSLTLLLDCSGRFCQLLMGCQHLNEADLACNSEGRLSLKASMHLKYKFPAQQCNVFRIVKRWAQRHNFAESYDLITFVGMQCVTIRPAGSMQQTLLLVGLSIPVRTKSMGNERQSFSQVLRYETGRT